VCTDVLYTGTVIEPLAGGTLSLSLSGVKGWNMVGSVLIVR